MNKDRTVSLLFPLFLSGCCWTDHTATIKKIAQPMQDKLVSFYQKNRRPPDVQERNDLLQSSGCMMTGNKCTILGKTLLVASKTEITENYAISVSLENSNCHFGLNSQGLPENLLCYNTACIAIKQ